MNKKRLLALLLTLAMALSLAACSGGGQGGGSATPTPQAQTPSGGDATPAPDAPTGEQVEIVWWAFPTFGVDSGYEQELANAFMAANSDVKVKVETIDFQSGPLTRRTNPTANNTN